MPIHAEELRQYLSQATGRPVRLRINDNTHSMISTGRDGSGPGIRLSLHRSFLEADDHVIRAIAQFVAGPTDECRRVIRSWISKMESARLAQPRAIPARNVAGTPIGKHHNLAQLGQAVNLQYFAGQIVFRIIWGKTIKAGKSQRHVTLGTWNHRQRIVRIHPMLDHPNVPRYFLDFVLYHELTHAAVPSRISPSGKMQHHGEDFRQREEDFPQFTLAKLWEQKWIGALIRSWNGGAPLPAEANDFFG